MSARLSNRLTIVLVAALIAAALALSPFGTPAGADHQPADKIAVAGSGVELVSTGPALPGTPDQPLEDVVSLGSGTLRASSPSDWIITVTAECALWTDVTTLGDDDSEAFAQIVVWIEHTSPDGTMRVIPVAGDDDGTETPVGEVVFCDRTYQRRTTNFDEEMMIETFLKTRSANAFQWITLNVGNGVHTIEAKARITREASSLEGTARADGAVGKRTLVVEPVKLANDAEI